MITRAGLVGSLAAMLIAAVIGAAPAAAPAARTSPPPRAVVSILVYHRFGPTVADSMTVRTATFRSQLEYLKQHQHPVVPLRDVVAFFLGRGPAPPPRAVVITADDGHQSVFSEMLPIVSDYRVPVTLFIYPSAISNASYALRWEQLRTLRDTGLFDVESHTYWHPNFNTERRRLAPAAYRTFVAEQFVRSRAVLHARLGVDASVLAWPFGIHDDDLAAAARDAGYVAGLTLGGRMATAEDAMMALPRFLMTDTASGRRFAAMLPGENP